MAWDDLKQLVCWIVRLCLGQKKQAREPVCSGGISGKVSLENAVDLLEKALKLDYLKMEVDKVRRAK